MNHIKKRRFKLEMIKKIGLSYLFLCIGLALFTTIWSIYLDSFFNNASTVGFLTTIFLIAGVISFLFFIPLIEKTKKMKLFYLSLIIFIISFSIFSIFSNIYLVVVLGMILAIFTSLRVTIFGILVRDNSQSKQVAENEGIIYTLLNLAYFIGPLVAGYLAQKFGFQLVFFIAALFCVGSLISFKIFKIKDNRISKKIDYNLFKIILEFFSKKDRVKTYILSATVTFWFALLYIYVPIHIIRRGYSPFLVGLFLATIIIPLILFEYPFGKLAGRKGFKKLFFLGCFILSMISLICFFFSNIYVLLFLLLIAGIGIAMIESTSEAYFFDIIKKEQRDKFYGIYNTAIDAGYFVGTFFPAIILLFLPFNFVFIFFSVVLFLVSLLTLTMKEVLEFRRN